MTQDAKGRAVTEIRKLFGRTDEEQTWTKTNFVFPLQEWSKKNYTRVPTRDELRPWVAQLRLLGVKVINWDKEE